MTTSLCTLVNPSHELTLSEMHGALSLCKAALIETADVSQYEIRKGFYIIERSSQATASTAEHHNRLLPATHAVFRLGCNVPITSPNAQHDSCDASYRFGNAADKYSEWDTAWSLISIDDCEW
eukprot:3026-Heterococcus_DN1.PRE.2